MAFQFLEIILVFPYLSIDDEVTDSKDLAADVSGKPQELKSIGFPDIWLLRRLFLYLLPCRIVIQGYNFVP